MNGKTASKVLVWGGRRVGDAVMSIPGMKLLRKHAPGAFVYYVTTEYAQEVIQVTGLADDITPIILKGGIRNFFRWGRLRKEARRGAYDLVLLYAKSTTFQEKIGTLETVVSIHAEQERHRALCFIQTVAKGLGLDEITIVSPQVAVPEDPVARQKLLGLGLNSISGNHVVIHPGCNRIMRKAKGRIRPDKNWPPAKYVEFFTVLSKTHPELELVLVGSNEETKWIKQGILDRLPPSVRPLDLSGRTSIRDVLQILRRARLLVCGDSGVMHLGTMTGTPTVSLFGPTDERRTGPFNMGERALIIRVMTLEEARADPDCMDKIDVDLVFDAAEKQLKTFPPASDPASPISPTNPPLGTAG